MNELVEKCIKNSMDRIEKPKHKMNVKSNISYLTKTNDLTNEEVDYIRKQVNKYIDKNFTKLFEVSFTINGLYIKKDLNNEMVQ